MSKAKNHLRLVEPAKVQHYAVIGVEFERGKAYFQAFRGFSSPLIALQYRGAAKDLHQYQAYERYHAVAVYGDGSIHELFYRTLETVEEDARPFTSTYPTLSLERLQLTTAASV